MIQSRENKKNASEDLKSFINKFRKNNPRLDIVLKTDDQNRKSENQAEINKEIIRRLRIQNKKLIEQVNKLKEELRKKKYNKIEVINRINDLLTLLEG
jgi:hypothetical protein